MDSTRWNQVKELFSKALVLDTAQRAEFLASQCGSDSSLRGQVEALLTAHSDADGFLTPPESGVLDIEQSARPAETIPPSEAWLSKTIDRYKLVRKIGEGGFGTVYLAEQVEPVRRQVALKIIKPGMDTKQVVARFEVERQALAMMDHPHIARVLDAGSTEAGRPYFVMELVKGVTITKYCDDNHLTTDARLELFIRVCGAVQHAHQKGIIHRDLKPSNVMVTLRDGKPVPKVIDFGVARATSQRLTEKTVFTELGQLIGTPIYMSPEQAELTGLDVDTRTDIYSLGVLLYELLVGTTPFDLKRLREAGFAEIQRIIREEEPPKPSTRLSSLTEEATDIAKHRKIEPAALGRIVRGDLDWIAMKALEKDRTRRYETADGLALDIRRHLGNEPVTAGAPSASYRAVKFIRRHRVGVTAAILVSCALVLGAAGTTYQAFRARGAEARATRHLEVQRAVTAILRSTLTSPNPDVDGADVRVVTVVDRTARQLPALAEGQPEVEAAVRAIIGETYLNLARFDEAEPNLKRALELRKELYGEDHLDVAESLFQMGRLLRERDDLDAAEASYRRSLAIREQHLGPRHALVGLTAHSVGIVLLRESKLEEAEAYLRRSLDTGRCEGATRDPECATTMTVLGKLLGRRGEYDDAEPLHREALAIYRGTHGNEHITVARALGNLASLLGRMNRLDDAEDAAREALAIGHAAYGGNEIARASDLTVLAAILNKKKEHAEAEALLEEALSIYVSVYGESHSYVAGVRLRLAEVRDDRGESEAAAKSFQDVVNMYIGAHGADDWRVAVARSRLGACLTGLERYEEAERNLLSAHAVLSAGGYLPKAGEAASRLSDLYDAWQKPESAAKWRALSEKEATGEGH